MSEIVKEGDSASDVSSNSSWTVLTEGSRLEDVQKPGEEVDLQNNSDSECVLVEEGDAEKEVKRPELPVEKSGDGAEGTASSESSNAASKVGFLTLEEYVAERAIEHDYEYDDKAVLFDEMLESSPKQAKSKHKKTKAQTFGTLGIIGAVLSVAGISLLCLLSPHTTISSDKLTENITTNFNKVAESYDGAEKFTVFLDGSNDCLKLIDVHNLFGECAGNQEEFCLIPPFGGCCNDCNAPLDGR